MKVVTRVRLADQEREFDIACGTGERTFKWLANAACQRFALAAPMGALRRCDEAHGITDRVQYTPAQVYLPSGEIPDPQAQLKGFLRYGDAVVVQLSHLQTVDANGSGTPVRSTWNADAFTKTGHRDSDAGESRAPGKVHEYFPPVDKGTDTAAQVRAKADFMRLILHSQMLNYKVVEERFDAAWAVVSKAMPHINELAHGGREMRQIFIMYMGTVNDVMERYATMGKDKKMSPEGLVGFVSEAGIFLERDAKPVATKTHKRVCAASRR